MRLLTGCSVIFLVCAAALGQAAGTREHGRGNSAALARRVLESARQQWRAPTPRPSTAKRVVLAEQSGLDPTHATGGDITQCPAETVCPQQPTLCEQTECPATPTQCPERTTMCPQILTECPSIVTQCPADPTLCGPCRATDADMASPPPASSQRADAGMTSLHFTAIPLYR
jgi:hypothetical protein